MTPQPTPGLGRQFWIAFAIALVIELVLAVVVFCVAVNL